MTALEQVAPSRPYVAYSYSYPHKSAYQPLVPAVPLAPLWRSEPRDSLFLYLHVPFCEMRCGFCNLFTRANPAADVVDHYLTAVARQARVVGRLLGDFAFARFALGGGTPTLLSPRQLEFVFDLMEREFRVRPHTIPASVETSPTTATADRLAILRDRGVERVSIGVQSFIDAEVHAIGRPQNSRDVRAALDRLRNFPVLNIDLIYGQPAQTTASWLVSVRAALEYRPAELFLYPLYVRPQTGIGKRGQARRAAEQATLTQYRAARDLLLSEGYEQVSMRCFRLPGVGSDTAPTYCCQRDGMIGLGCGARSYTSRLHYSSRFAVGAAEVQAIIAAWSNQNDADFAHATWGFHHDDEERRRRYVIQSLLHRDGIMEAEYEARFGEPLLVQFSELHEWQGAGCVAFDNGRGRLTERGLELSDALGPALYSPARLAELREFDPS